MAGSVTWSDVKDVVDAVSVRLLDDDGGPLTERPSKRQRLLVPVSAKNPVPAPEALPDLTWSGWASMAQNMQLNDTHGPGFVHDIAQLYAKQQRHAALPSEHRPLSPVLVDVELQRLAALLRLAQAQVGAMQSSGQGEAEQPQQLQQHEGVRQFGDSCARQPLTAAWPDGMPTATQLLESQADELVAVGTIPFKIAGKDWMARGDRGKEVHYLVVFQGHAAGEEDWKPARLIRKSAGGAAAIAEYERALEAGELDASQQQSQADNPGAAARASQQSQQVAPSLPAIPEAAPHQLKTSSGGPAPHPRQQVPDQRQQQQRRQQPVVARPQVQVTSSPRLQHGRPVPHDPEADQASLQQPEQQAAADAAQRSQGDAAVASMGQSQAQSHVLPTQMPTDSQWLAAETQTQAPASSTLLVMDMVPFTQGSQPSKASDGAHRRPLPAPTAAAAAPIAAGSGPTAPAARSIAAAGPQLALVPSAAAPARPTEPSASPAAAIRGAPAPAAPQAAEGLAVPQVGTAAAGSDEDSAPPDPRTRLGVEKLLRRLSSHATWPAHRPQLQHAAQAQQASTQQQPALPHAARDEQHQEQEAAPQQHLEARSAATACDGGGGVADKQHRQPSAASGPGLAVAGGGTAAAAPGKMASSNSAAISLDSSDEDEGEGEGEDEDDEHEDEATLKLKAEKLHLQPDRWAAARIIRAKRNKDGDLYIMVKWDDDNYDAFVPSHMLKAEDHCRLKLLDFYESKIKAVSRKTNGTDVTD